MIEEKSKAPPSKTEGRAPRFVSPHCARATRPAEAAEQVGAAGIATSVGASSFAGALHAMSRANPMSGGQLDPFLGPKVIAGARGLATLTGRLGLAAEHAIPRVLPVAVLIAADASMVWGLGNEIYAAATGKCH